MADRPRTREDEQALVDACVAGDVGAHRRLILAYNKVVRQAVSFLSAARSGAVPEADLEDAVQQAFLTFFSNDAAVLGHWAGRSSLRTYLCRIAERVAIRHFQRTLTRRGRFRLSLDAPGRDGTGAQLDRVQDSTPPLDARLIRVEERERLRDLIRERLSEKGRTYYDYLFVEELDVPEVALRENTNPNNVYQWKNRIARLAGKVLDEEGYK